MKNAVSKSVMRQNRGCQHIQVEVDRGCQHIQVEVDFDRKFEVQTQF